MSGFAGFSGFPGTGCGSSTSGVAFPTRNGSIDESAGTVDLRIDCGNLTRRSRVRHRLDRRGHGCQRDRPRSDLKRHDANGQVDRPRRAGLRPVREPRGVERDPARRAEPRPVGPRQRGLGDRRSGRRDARRDGPRARTPDRRPSTSGQTRAIESLDARLNAGSLSLTLPNLSFDGSIEANAGSVKLCAPDGAALRLHTDGSNLASFDYSGQGLVQDGETWTTPGFDTAAVKIDLRTQANAGSFALNPEAGCE